MGEYEYTDKKYFRFMKRDGDLKGDFDFLWFHIGKFHFKWFLDCYEWFIYLEWWKPDVIKGYRFSSAGNMKLNYRR